MSFLPDNYEPPARGNYMKLQTGENRLRCLGPAIVGNVFWVTENDGSRKPVRRRLDEIIQEHEIGFDSHGQREKVKHFWAFPIWNCKDKAIQILEVTQSTIQDAIRNLCESPDWGDPMGYDLIIRKEGSSLDTKYHVTPGRPSAIDPAVLTEFEAARIDMNELFAGGDPFGAIGEGSSNGSPSATSQSGYKGQSITTLHDVTRMHRNGADLFQLQTDEGRFFTDDAEQGARSEKLKGADVSIDWELNSKGGKVVKVIAGLEPQGAAGHQALEEDDIPF